MKPLVTLHASNFDSNALQARRGNQSYRQHGSKLLLLFKTSKRHFANTSFFWGGG